jgi:hypothetical protein
VRSVTIRLAGPADDAVVARLAALDSQRPPVGPLLLGEVEGVLWAAVALEGSAAIADPFRPSAELVALLRAQARLHAGEARTARRRRVRRRTALA